MSANVVAFVPNVTGRLHIGNTLTYFANWLLARRYGHSVVVIPDWSSKQEQTMDDVTVWRRQTLDELTDLGIRPDRFLCADEVLELRPAGEVIRASANTLQHCYVCDCLDYPTPMMHVYDPCARTLEHSRPKAVLRLKRYGLYVGCVADGKYWLGHDVVMIQLYQNAGVTRMVRGLDLRAYAERQSWILQTLGPMLGWHPIETLISPTLQTNGVKLAKSTGAVPTIETIKAIGQVGLLEALYAVLQSRSAKGMSLRAMAEEFEPHRIPQESICVHRLFRAHELDDGHYCQRAVTSRRPE